MISMLINLFYTLVVATGVVCRITIAAFGTVVPVHQSSAPRGREMPDRRRFKFQFKGYQKWRCL